MASNGWEYVGKKKTDKKSAKPQKKRVPEASDPTQSEGMFKICAKNDTSFSTSLILPLIAIKGPIKLSETAFQAFNDLENRKTKTNTLFNHKTTVDENHQNVVNEKKVPKNKTKKKTSSPNESPKTQLSTKPLTFEEIAKQVSHYLHSIVLQLFLKLHLF